LINLFPKYYFNHSSDSQFILITIVDWCHRCICVSLLIIFVTILADRTATQYDRLLASSCSPSVRPSVCNTVHCGSHGRCTGLKVVLACS